ncbi:hypothetical protein [Caminibacter sp.]
MDKIEFLYKSIEDIRSSIRALDTKSNFVIAFVIGIFFVYIKMTNKLFNCLSVIFFIFGFLTIITLFYFVINSRINPKEKIVYHKEKDNFMEFFPINLKNFSDYYQMINSMDKDKILKILSFERLKLQIIFHEKNFWYKIAIYCFQIPFFIFFILELILFYN